MCEYVKQIARALLQQQAMLSCAESCTGGWIAKTCTDLAGSSAWFDCGFVTYSNQSKQTLLQIPQALITEHGAVSEPVVRAMAQGALQQSSAQYAVAVSGIAGPDGGSADKPVGTVWFAWSHVGGDVRTLCEHFSGDREAVRQATVTRALQELVMLIQPLAVVHKNN